MIQELTDEQIVHHLIQKELSLIGQLEKVRAALGVYGHYSSDGIVIKSVLTSQSNIDNQELDCKDYDLYLSYEQKVIYALRKIDSGYIDTIKDFLISIGDTTDSKKLFGGITGAASKLYGRHILKADTRGRKYKYYLNSDTEKERAEILPL